MKTLELENLRLIQLDADALEELNGGGWIADFVESFVHGIKCQCGPGWDPNAEANQHRYFNTR